MRVWKVKSRMISSYHALCFASAWVLGAFLLGVAFVISPITIWAQVGVFALILLAIAFLAWISTPSHGVRELKKMEQLALTSAWIGLFLCVAAILAGWWVGGRAGASLNISAVAAIAFVRLVLHIQLRNLKAIQNKGDGGN